MALPDAEQPPVRHWYSRGYLPHYDVPGISQLISFRQEDSVPARLVRAYAAVLNSAKSDGPYGESSVRVATHLERFLGKGRGSCRLRDPRAARILEDALLFYDRRDYELIAWVVMPNHVHVVVKSSGTRSLESITRRWKSWTAHEINRLFGTSGRFWQKESFDHWLRDLEQQANAVRYVEMNPVKAGLCVAPLDWPHSSARRWPERWEGVTGSCKS